MTALIPNSRFTCDMFGGGCRRPATHIVDAKIRIRPGVDDFEPLHWLTCDDIACLTSAQTHADAWGQHVDTRRLTVAEAEELTGYLAVTA